MNDKLLNIVNRPKNRKEQVVSALVKKHKGIADIEILVKSTGIEKNTIVMYCNRSAFLEYDKKTKRIRFISDRKYMKKEENRLWSDYRAAETKEQAGTSLFYKYPSLSWPQYNMYMKPLCICNAWPLPKKTTDFVHCKRLAVELRILDNLD